MSQDNLTEVKVSSRVLKAATCLISPSIYMDYMILINTTSYKLLKLPSLYVHIHTDLILAVAHNETFAFEAGLSERVWIY